MKKIALKRTAMGVQLETWGWLKLLSEGRHYTAQGPWLLMGQRTWVPPASRVCPLAIPSIWDVLQHVLA